MTHYAYVGLYSGMLAKIDGKLIGLPPMTIQDSLYWSRMRVLAIAIYPVVLLLVLFGYDNAWANIGLVLGFTLTVVCNRVTPFPTGYPLLLVFIQFINVAMIVLHVVVACSRWHK